MGIHVHKIRHQINEAISEEERTVDGAIARLMEEFNSVLEVHVLINPAISRYEGIETRTYHRDNQD